MKKSMLTLSALLMSIAAVFAQQTDTSRTQESDQYRRTEGVQSTQPQTEPSNQMRDTTGLPADTTNLEGTQPEGDTTGVSGTTPVQYDTGAYQTNRKRKSGNPRKEDE